jgi:predicted small secreted protein
MARTRTALLGLLAVLAGAVVLLSGCRTYGPMGQDVSNLGGARFHQTQAVMGFDDSDYTLTADAVTAFKDLLTAHDIDPGSYDAPDSEGCTGGITTRVQMWFYGGGDREMIIDGCAAEDGSFEQEATDFFSGIRTGDTANPAPSASTIPGPPNSDISAITFSQQQAVAGFDDGEYRQEGRAELDKFIAELDLYGVVASEYVAPTGPPCAGGLSSDAVIEYTGTDQTAELLLDSCIADDGFTEVAQHLFTEWSVTLGK